MCTRKLKGKAVEFGTTGYTMNSIFVLYDRESDSVWYPQTASTLNAVAGEKQGDSVKILSEPAPQALGLWLDENPDSLILIPSARDMARTNRVYLGVQIGESDHGILLASVGEGTPAAKAGIKAGDVLLSIGGEEVSDLDELRASLGGYSIGDNVTLLIERDGKRRKVKLTFGGRD